MRELLEEFWYGNVTPQEQYTNHHPKVDDLLRLADKNLTKLSETLMEAQKELLKKYDESIGELNSIMERELFIYAFRLGGRFMVARYRRRSIKMPYYNYYTKGSRTLS